VPDLRGWSCPGAVAGGFAVTGCASDGETGRPLTPRKRETGRLLTPGASVRWPLRLEGDCREEGSPYWPWVFEGLIWVLGPPGDRRRLRPERFRLLRFRRSRGVDGWPSRVRAVDAPASQDVPAWEGIVPGSRLGSMEADRAWKGSRRAPLTLLRAMQRDVDLMADGQYSLQTANRRYAAFWQPSTEVRPLAGSLHRRGRLRSDGPGERS
jgi:hypothetical protein